MRVGIDARLWNESGVGRYTRNLIFELQKIDRGTEYVLFALHKDFDNILSQIKNPNVRVIGTNIRWHSLSEQVQLPHMLYKQKLDLMHFPYFSVPIIYNKPFVVTIHDLILHHFSTGEASTLSFPIYRAKHMGYSFIMSQAARRAKKIITILESTKQEIVDHLGVEKNKISVMYEGVDKKVIGDDADKVPASVKKPFILHVGNVYPHKNADRLVEAFDIFSKEDKLIQLVFVGRTDYFQRRLKKKIHTLASRERITFVGEVSDGELSQLYRNAAALFIPSLMEGFGLPAVEAMANACIVIASDIPSLKEVCKNAALYFDPYNTESLVNMLRIVTAKKKQEFRENIRAGQKRVLDFSWEKMAKETQALY